MLDRDEDMICTGMRHPFKVNVIILLVKTNTKLCFYTQADYKVGFTATGRITALDVQMYSNGILKL